MSLSGRSAPPQRSNRLICDSTKPRGRIYPARMMPSKTKPSLASILGESRGQRPARHAPVIVSLVWACVSAAARARADVLHGSGGPLGPRTATSKA